MRNESYSGIVGPGGSLTITIAPKNQLVTWRVSQVSAQLATAPIGAVCQLTHNSDFVTFLVATGDVADGTPPIDVIPGDALSVIWTGCTPGSSATVKAFYDIPGET
jgi:hypothetical protein